MLRWVGQERCPPARQNPMPLNVPHSWDVAIARAQLASPTEVHLASFHVAPRLRFSEAYRTW